MTEQISPPTIRDMLRTLNSAEDKDADFVIACAFNIYLESLKRLHNRVLLGPSDIKAMLAMADILLTERTHVDYVPAQRSARLAPEEEQKLLNVVEDGVLRRN